MNGEFPRVPITTLSGVSSLVDLLPEMPLPTPLPQTLNTKSLLFHPRVAEEAGRLLTITDDNLTMQLINSLGQTSSKHIELNDEYQENVFEQQNAPALLSGILMRKSDVFKGKQDWSRQHHHQNQQTTNHPPHHHQQHSHNSEGNVNNQFDGYSPNSTGHLPQPLTQQSHFGEQALHSSPLGNLSSPELSSLAAAGQLFQGSPSQQLPLAPNVIPSSSSSHFGINSFPSVGLTNSFNKFEKPVLHVPVPKMLTPPINNSHSNHQQQQAYPKNLKDQLSPMKSAPINNLKIETKLEQNMVINSTVITNNTNSNSVIESKNSTKDHNQILQGPQLKLVLPRMNLNNINYSTPVTEVPNTRSGGVKKDPISPKEKKPRITRSERSSADSSGAGGNNNIHELESPKRKIRRMELKLVPLVEKLGGNVLNNNTYHRFLKLMEVILDSYDYCDKNDMDVDEDDNVAPELLIPKAQLSELCAEAAKLRALGAMEAIPADKIVRLLSVLEKNIRDGSKVTPLADPDETEEEGRLWVELTMESIIRGVLASLTALHVLTSPNMPKKVYMEDLIDRIVIFTKFQLQNTIYPSFDPVYRIGGKESGASNKKKRAHAKEVREKSIISFYHKIHEVVALLADLLNVQVLTDTTVLHLSTLGVSPFFVEKVDELQLSALKLVTGIFAQYEMHRKLLLDDILASIARLPSSKRGLRTFKLSTGSEDYIQMLTALVLQLIQCVTYLPDKLALKTKNLAVVKTEEGASKERTKQTELDTLIGGRYDTAYKIAASFLAVFLSKCGNKSEDCDYRQLFENFVQDLLSTVNKPQWPAAELLLSLLGMLLVKNMTNKNCEVSMRVSSLEYLGVAAARLRKDSVSSRLNMDIIDRIINDIKKEEDADKDEKEKEDILNSDEKKMEFLQRLLLDYLAVIGESDPALMHARHFYITSWWKSAATDIAKSLNQRTNSTSSKKAIRSNKKKKKKGESSEDELTSSTDMDEDEEEKETETSAKVLELKENRKTFLLSKVRPFADKVNSKKTEYVQTYVDSHSAELITRYLASKRPFSASFDFFLKRILSVSTEQTVAIRTKALRCLTMVIEADANVLALDDIQLWVRNSFLDQSTSVREAAVDLVGKYVLSCPDLIEKYYETLEKRILDTGVSVRKRVIKILRDICIEHPKFPKIPEICVKMIRRVNDEDGIRKLVMEVFQNMWFTPVKEEPLDTESLLRKVSHITDVVASCEKVGLDFFEQLLLSLFRPRDDKEDVREKVVNKEPPLPVLTASSQIVDCLVEHVLRLEENSTDEKNNPSSRRFVACVATLHLFAKIRPQLLVKHAITLEGYLSLRAQTAEEVAAIANIASILEMVIPLLVNPSDTFLSQIEEDCVKLIFKNEKTVIESCLACLGAVANKITHNYKLVRDVFGRYQKLLFTQTSAIRSNPTDPRLSEQLPRIRRAIYTIGIFLRYFDFAQPEVYGDFSPNIVHSVFNELLYLVGPIPLDLQYFTLQAIGHLCIRHYELMLENELKSIYQQLLTSTLPSEVKLKIQVLLNIQLYLTEEELRMIKQDQEWAKHSKIENIKEMGDVSSGMASTVVQIYLKQILESFIHPDVGVRLAAVRVIQLVLQQGLVHPIQIVPYLICMSTDEENGVSTTADKQLQEIEKKHPQFLQSQVLNGIRLSLQLQRVLKAHDISSLAHPYYGNNLPIVRGFRTRPKEGPSALNGFLYSLLRTIKPQRRGIALSLLKQFDEQNKTLLCDLLYYADNLAYFPYQVVDEPLFIIHHIDILISVSGSNLLQAFKETLIPIHNPVIEHKVVENNISNINNGNNSNTFITGNMILDPISGTFISDGSSTMNGGENIPMDLGLNEFGIIDANNVVGGAVNNIEESIRIENPDGQVVVVKKHVPDILEDEDDEDIESLVKRIPEDTKTLEECINASQGCLLLLMVKQHLKDTYGITDTRISGYSPSDATKIYERPVNRRNAQNFVPKCTLANLKQPILGDSEEGRKALVEQYTHFKQLMLRIDPEENEDDEVKQPKIKIDQNMFQYSAVTQNSKKSNIPSYPNEVHITNNPPTTPTFSGNSFSSNMNSNSSTPLLNNNNNPITPQYIVKTQFPTPTNLSSKEPLVRIPKLTIVPLKFPGGGIEEISRKSHKKDHHHHHHKHKNSKHKKKKKHVVSDDEDSDNDSDPDFRL